jgi:hypothetical protein
MSSLDVEVTRDLAVSTDVVWDYVVAGFFGNHPRWDPAIVELRKLTEGEVRVGTRGVEVRNFGGRQEAEFVISELTPKRRFAFSNTTGPFKLERRYDFADGGRTRLTFHFSMAPKGIIRLIFPLLRGPIAKQVESNIDRLCRLLMGIPSRA